MPQLDQFPSPMVAGSTGLNANQTWLKAFKKCQNLRPSQSTIERNLTILINTVDLKNVLSQIEADCCNMNWVAPLISSLRHLHYSALRRRLMQEPSTPSAVCEFTRCTAKGSFKNLFCR